MHNYNPFTPPIIPLSFPLASESFVSSIVSPLFSTFGFIHFNLPSFGSYVESVFNAIGDYVDFSVLMFPEMQEQEGASARLPLCAFPA